ncbi:MAG: peroxiredoxin [Candidatus Micrarchaeota archaeon]|nr:peroxiredoxin [Candidatus Micrarchaeota archaeon]
MVSVGQKVPDFVLPDQSGKMVRLSDFKDKAVVLYFYPKDDTPGCTTEACNFRDSYEKIKKLGAQVVGVSADSVQSHSNFAKKYSLPFPLLSDTKKEVATKFGAIKNGNVSRCTFIIGKDGRLLKSFMTVDPAKHDKEVISFLEAL